MTHENVYTRPRCRIKSATVDKPNEFPNDRKRPNLCRMNGLFVCIIGFLSSRGVVGFSPSIQLSKPTRIPPAESARLSTSSWLIHKSRRKAKLMNHSGPFVKVQKSQISSALLSKVVIEDEEVKAQQTMSIEIAGEQDIMINLIEKIETMPITTPTEEIINTQLDPSFTPILALCFLVTLLSALDRVAMSIAILSISDEYNFSETVKGSIASAVSYGYGLAILPIGIAVSVMSSRILMMGGVALWSLATLATPFMVELSNAGVTVFLLPLLAVRGVMGAAEAVVLPTMQRVLANWVPAEKKASILGTILAGFQVGTLSAYVVSPLVMDTMRGIDGGPDGIDGWRGLFYVYGVLGLLWMFPWWFLAKDAPDSNREILKIENCEESLVNNMVEGDFSLVLEECPVDNKSKMSADKSQRSPLDGVVSLLQSAPWNDLLMSKGVWAITLAHAAKNFELYNLLAWTPTFFSEQYGLNIKESALFSVVPSICGMVGGLTAGNAADYVLLQLEQDETDGKSNDKKRTLVRKAVQSVALFGPAACFYSLSYLPEQATTAQLLLGGAVGLQTFDVAGFGAATQDKAGSKWSGLLYSLTSLPGVLVGSFSVSITGKILDAVTDGTGWVSVFQLNAAVCSAGALCFVALYDSRKEFD